jgi:hypothetical protein
MNRVPRDARAVQYRRRGALIAMASASALALSAPAQARVHAPSVAKCTIMISGAHWSIAGSGSGSTYKVVANGMACSVAATWVRKFTHRPGGTLGATVHAGPAGYTCRSLSTPASGDKLMYAGVCVHAPGVPFFGWAAKR